MSTRERSMRPTVLAAASRALACGLMVAAGFTGTTHAAPAPDAKAAERDVIVYASSLPKTALSEFVFWNDPASPGGKLAGTHNSGGNLDPPPEDDPHVMFEVQVEGGVAYRCWIHMKVGAPKGVSKANKFWVQFTKAVDAKGKEFLKPSTSSYLTAQGPAEQGWAWVPCLGAGEKSPGAIIKFKSSGKVTVRMQAGMEGVGFDQFILSPVRFFDQAPTDSVVAKQ